MITQKERIDRVQRSRNAELEKIEVHLPDTDTVELDTRILNKLMRKSGRFRR